MEPLNDPIVGRIIGCAIEVHSELGPGLLESTYDHCMAYEMTRCGLRFEQQLKLPVTYKDITLKCAYRIDFIVEGHVVVEVKAVEYLLPVHQAQVLTYMKLLNVRRGLLLNFNTPRLKDGLKSLLL
jgi:GxxExxY protein